MCSRLDITTGHCRRTSQADIATLKTSVPTLVIGGYLGAGKTTLVNHLLRHAASGAGGQRIAVLVNDFGSINIDASLITGQQGEVMSLAGGCVCCSFGADLVGMLGQVVRREPPPDVVLIEASGVALPASVARSARLAAGVHVEGIVVLADAGTVQAMCQDPYVGDVLRQQLNDSDLVLLNKMDLVAAIALPGLLAWLRGAAPRATDMGCTQGDVPVEMVLGLRAKVSHESIGGLLAGAQTLHPIASASERFVSATLALVPGSDPHALAQQWAAQSQGLVRAKGFVTDAHGQRWLLQAVGPRWTVTQNAATVVNVGHDTLHSGADNTLVMIGLRGRFTPP